MKISSGAKISTEGSERPSLAAVAALIFRIGSTTFASGAATIALIGREFERRGWMGPAQFDLCFTLSRTSPGTNVFGFVAAACWSVRGWLGAVAGVLALSIPAAVVTILLTMAYQTWRDHPAGKYAIAAVMACIVGVMLAGGWLLIRPRLTSFRTAVFVLGALIASMWLSPLVIMGLAAAAGYAWAEDRA